MNLAKSVVLPNEAALISLLIEQRVVQEVQDDILEVARTQGFPLTWYAIPDDFLRTMSRHIWKDYKLAYAYSGIIMSVGFQIMHVAGVDEHGDPQFVMPQEIAKAIKEENKRRTEE